MQLAHALDHGLAALGVERDAEAGVLLGEPAERGRHLLLVGLGLGLDRDRLQSEMRFPHAYDSLANLDGCAVTRRAVVLELEARLHAGLGKLLPCYLRVEMRCPLVLVLRMRLVEGNASAVTGTVDCSAVTGDDRLTNQVAVDGVDQSLAERLGLLHVLRLIREPVRVPVVEACASQPAPRSDVFVRSASAHQCAVAIQVVDVRCEAFTSSTDRRSCGLMTSSCRPLYERPRIWLRRPGT